MLRPKIQVPRLPPREGGSDFAQASMRLQTISRLGLGRRSHPFKLTAQGAILRIARIREKLLDTTIESLDPLRGNGIEKMFSNLVTQRRLAGRLLQRFVSM